MTPQTSSQPEKSANLSFMMFFQYAVWGVWLPYLANYLLKPVELGGLGFSGAQVGWILGLAGSIGAISAPVIAGQVADRYLNAEKALAILLALGGVAIFMNASSVTYGRFLFLSVLYSVLYMPTLSLTNSICFHNLKDSEKSFPAIRLWGTIGWIAASNLFPLLWVSSAPDEFTATQRLVDSLRVAGVAAFLYAAWALFFLPKTPPQKGSSESWAFLKAFSFLKNRGFLLITLLALPVSLIHQAYFFRVGPFYEQEIGVPLKWIGTVLSIGQVSEIFFLLFLGTCLKRFGYRNVLMLGCLGYLVRFAIFGLASPAWLVIAAQALHGLCYGFFFAASFLYVEKISPRDIRHSTQTVFGIIILGLGPVFAGLYNQYWDAFKVKQLVGTSEVLVQDYRLFWSVQSIIALLVLLIIWKMFDRVSGAPEN